MDFNLVNPLNPVIETVLFTPNPQTVDVSDGARIRTYNPQELGSAEFPRGRTPWRIAFKSFFPGGSRVGSVFAPLDRWRPPGDLVYQLEAWQGNRTKLLFIVTDTEINKDVFIAQFSRTWGSGYGDVPYTIELHEWRDMLIAIDTNPAILTAVGAATIATTQTVSGEPDRAADNRATGVVSGQPDRAEDNRSTDPSPDSYTVKENDTLYGIAATQLGDGTRWSEIYILNNFQISDPDVIQVGMTLNMPTSSTSGAGGGVLSPQPDRAQSQRTNVSPGPLAP